MTHIVSHNAPEGLLSLKLLFPTPKGPRPLPEPLDRALFGPAETPEWCFAVLDAGQVPNLALMLEQSGLERRCLSAGKTTVDLEEHAPWLVHMTPGARRRVRSAQKRTPRLNN